MELVFWLIFGAVFVVLGFFFVGSFIVETDEAKAHRLLADLHDKPATR